MNCSNSRAVTCSFPTLMPGWSLPAAGVAAGAAADGVAAVDGAGVVAAFGFAAFAAAGFEAAGFAFGAAAGVGGVCAIARPDKNKNVTI
jgi:hypothetical protein